MHNKKQIIVIFLIIYFCLSSFFYIFFSQYSRIYLPFVKVTLNTLYPDYFKFRSIKLEKQGKELFCEAVIEGEVIKNNKSVRAQIKYQKTIKISFIALYPAIIFPLLICWPGLSLKIRTLAMIGAIQIFFFITCLDLSLTIMYFMEEKLCFHNTAQILRKITILFFNNGGRQFLAVIIAWFSIIVARWGFEQ